MLRTDARGKVELPCERFVGHWINEFCCYLGQNCSLHASYICYLHIIYLLFAPTDPILNLENSSFRSTRTVILYLKTAVRMLCVRACVYEREREM